MITNTTVCKVQQFFLCLTFSSLEFIGTVNVRFVTSIISLHIVTDSSTMILRYLPFWQIHLLGFQLQSFSKLMIIFTPILSCFTIPLLIWITCCTVKFDFTFAWTKFYQWFSFICFCYHINYLNIYTFCFTWDILLYFCRRGINRITTSITFT